MYRSLGFERECVLLFVASLATLIVWLFDSYATICVMLVRYLCDHVFDHIMINVCLHDYFHECLCMINHLFSW